MSPDGAVVATNAWMSWSSGKDSALALHAVRDDPGTDIVGLLTTVNADAGRVAMHAARTSLLKAQADRLGLPLHIVEIPSRCPNALYEERMGAAMGEARAAGVSQVVFGDSGIRAVVTCVDPRWVPADLVGSDYDEAFLRSLPAGVDPCGERGEFHTFVADAPGFSAPIDVAVGGVVEREGFVYCDVAAR